jgi:hydroxypyruvate isomerase
MIYEDEPLTRRIDRVAELGFEAVEIWSWHDRDIDAIEARLDDHDLALTSIAGNTEDARPENLERAMTDPETRAGVVADVEESIEVADRLDCPAVIVHLGPARDVPRDRAYDSVVEGLRELAPAAEAAGVTLLLEPLNHAVDHAGYFLEYSRTASEIVEAVDSPALGVLFDIYHQQITEGNIISNLRENLASIDHVHAADVPGRHEPGTGELHYPNILAALDDAGYEGYVGYEFTPATESRTALERIADLITTQ